MNSDPFSGTRALGRVLLAAIVARVVVSLAFLPLRYAIPVSMMRNAFAAHKWILLTATVVVVVLHIVWMRGYFVALRATGRMTKQSPNFTALGWFIPFANFVFPYLSAKQAHEAQGRSGGIALGWWIAYLVFTVNNAASLRVPFIGLVIAIVVFGLWFVMVKGLIDATKGPAMALNAMSGMGAPAASAASIPAEWGWVWVHQKAANLKVLGYYYRDRMAGPSLKMLVDLTTPLDQAQIAGAARAAGYQATSTFRLGAHETINVEGLPPDFASMMRAKYEKGESPAGPGCAIILRLTKAERDGLGLPNAPPHIEAYL